MKKVMLFDWVKMVGAASFFAVAIFFPAIAAALDQQSMECLGCHDAAIASDVSRQVCSEPANCDHPFAVDYSTASKSNRGLKPVGDLPQPVKLADDMTIGCGTCHVPFNMDDHSILSSMRNLYPGIPDPMLVMDNRQSELCYGCHLK
ncbi:hypothetical protein BAC3_02456 [uncultured bacterium]|nr:hypothetical protein BAC3_02456 [uncultured bacterium]